MSCPARAEGLVNMMHTHPCTYIYIHACHSYVHTHSHTFEYMEPWLPEKKNAFLFGLPRTKIYFFKFAHYLLLSDCTSIKNFDLYKRITHLSPWRNTSFSILLSILLYTQIHMYTYIHATPMCTHIHILACIYTQISVYMRTYYLYPHTLIQICSPHMHIYYVYLLTYSCRYSCTNMHYCN